eukprot:TRINITY_DN541_c0_g1_i1.p1 TRINITY_DN541_c0_g1~~TRINITY_DN541_c0_g1_i1.p1  ORF type:complete len:338 (+),score=130.43 TRINITY_DN541_c0_g1_i1:60-1073(+)
MDNNNNNNNMNDSVEYFQDPRLFQDEENDNDNDNEGENDNDNDNEEEIDNDNEGENDNDNDNEEEIDNDNEGENDNDNDNEGENDNDNDNEEEIDNDNEGENDNDNDDEENLSMRPDFDEDDFDIENISVNHIITKKFKTHFQKAKDLLEKHVKKFLNNSSIGTRKKMIEFRTIFNAYSCDKPEISKTCSLIYLNDLLELTKNKDFILKKLKTYFTSLPLNVINFTLQDLYNSFLIHCFDLLDFKNQGKLDFVDIVKVNELNNFLNFIDFTDFKLIGLNGLQIVLNYYKQPNNGLDLEDQLEKTKSEAIKLQTQYNMKIVELQILEVRLKKRYWKSK